GSKLARYFGFAYPGGEMMRATFIGTVLPLSVLLFALSAFGGFAPPPAYCAIPSFPEPTRGLLPRMLISKPAEWGDEKPTVPEGYEIEAIATDLKIPRQTLVLPNGDILVAEGSGGYAPVLRPKDLIASYIKKQGKSSVKP